MPWAHLLVAAAVIGTFTLLLRSASREAAREGGRRVLTYGPAWRWLSRGLWLAPVGFAVLALFIPAKPGEWWIPLALVGGFVALLVPLTLEVERRRIELGEDAIVSRSPWRGPVRMSWAEIGAVAWRAVANELELRSRAGGRLRVSVWLSGTGTLADELERLAPGAAGLREALAAFRSFGKSL